MTIYEHVGSAVAGFTSAMVIPETVQIPQTKTEIVALFSAVIVQSLIYGVSKLFGWLKKKSPQT